MALSAFDDKSETPRRGDLERVLGRSIGAWDALLDHLGVAYAPLTERWGYSGAKWGWSLRLIQKKRTILYMTPQERGFQVGFALGEKAVGAAREAGISRETLDVVDNAPKYPEGRGIRLQVRFKKDLPAVRTLAEAKMGS